MVAEKRDVVMITHSIVLSNCWCCESSLSLHQHHVVPREYGGSKGPTVTVCATCHNFVHHTATKLWVTKDQSCIAQINALKNTFDKNKVRYLIGVILKAKRATGKIDSAFEGNGKAVGVLLRLNPEQRRKFLSLKNTLKLSNRELLSRALDDLYKKVFAL